MSAKKSGSAKERKWLYMTPKQRASKAAEERIKRNYEESKAKLYPAGESFLDIIEKYADEEPEEEEKELKERQEIDSARETREQQRADDKAKSKFDSVVIDEDKFREFKASRAMYVERQLDKVRRRSAYAGRYQQSVEQFVDVRREQLDRELRREFRRIQREKLLGERKRRRKRHMRRNKSGQPIMDNLMKDLLQKIERDAPSKTKANKRKWKKKHNNNRF